ncbi:MAG: hypothetical protein ABGZ17_31055 [Planctomycetaceae bacterium]
MLSNMCQRRCAAWLLAMTVAGTTAQAQWYPTSQVCQCLQPAYQTVPVVEYRKVTQTVRRPVYETKYVEQPVTQYRPVLEQRTTQVPTVTYQNVTECRVVQANASRWVTSYQANPRLHPWRYDSRPDLMGWLNRTGYVIRQSFTPDLIPQRQFVPQTVAQNVPVTRRVAVQGTRKVTYNVTRMVPHRTTQTVAVNSVRYVDEKVTAMRPVTVMRTVQVGGLSTLAALPRSNSRTALVPIPDESTTNRPARTATQDRSASDGAVIRGRRDNLESSQRDNDTRRSSYIVPSRDSEPTQPRTAFVGHKQPSPSVARRVRSTPSIVRVSGWTVRRQRVPSSPTGPTLTSPGVAVAHNAP